MDTSKQTKAALLEKIQFVGLEHSWVVGLIKPEERGGVAYLVNVWRHSAPGHKWSVVVYWIGATVWLVAPWPKSESNIVSLVKGFTAYSSTHDSSTH